MSESAARQPGLNLSQWLIDSGLLAFLTDLIFTGLPAEFKHISKQRKIYKIVFS
jgi:hypothetical protein